MLTSNEAIRFVSVAIYQTFPLTNPMFPPTITAAVIALIILFGLGAFLGKTAKRNLIKAGLRMVLAGVVTAVFALLIGAVH